MSWLEGLRWRTTSFLGHLRARRAGVTTGTGISFLGIPIMSRSAGSLITIGSRSVLISTSAATALGVSGPLVLRTLRAGAQIHIGDDAGISGGTICSAASVRIGDRCLFGADCMIFDTDFHNLKARDSVGSPRRYSKPRWDEMSSPIVIGNDVFLGTRTMVLKGVTIGDGTVVAAGSIVTKSLPANCVAAGAPARILRYLTAPVDEPPEQGLTDVDT